MRRGASTVSEGCTLTVCIAALCDRRLSIILAADQKIGMDFVEGELDSGKIRWIHRLWRVMISGNDALPAFEIARSAKRRLTAFEKKTPRITTIRRIISHSYGDVRMDGSQESTSHHAVGRCENLRTAAERPYRNPFCSRLTAKCKDTIWVWI